MNRITRTFSVVTAAALLIAATAFADHTMDHHKSSMFAGPKANTGTVSHVRENGKSILRVSSDFKVPDTPAPTWRVVDSKGAIHTLDAFKIKGGEKREVQVPAYVRDIVKVEVYCAWAEILLGDAKFSSPVK